MSTNIGIVLDNSNDGYARIKINRSGACGGCDSSSGLFLVKLFDRSNWARHKLSPAITGVVSSRFNR